MTADGYYQEVSILLSTLKGEFEDQAITPYEDFFVANPDKAEPYYLLGLFSYRLNDYGSAIQFIEQAHEKAPECRDYADALACLYTVKGNLPTGLYYAKLATACQKHEYISDLLPPELENYFNALLVTAPSYHYLYALRAFNKRDFQKTIDEANKELSLNPNHKDCVLLRAKAYYETADYTRCANDADIVIKNMSAQDSIEAYLIKGKALLKYGMIVDAFAQFDVLFTSLNDDDEEFIRYSSEVINALKTVSVPYRDARALLLDRLDEKLKPHYPSTKKVPTSRKGRRLRIGYLSDKIYNTDDVNLLTSLLRHHDKNNFHITVYQANIREDTITKRLQNDADNWVRIHDLDDYVLNFIIGNEEIDILVDLIGINSTRPNITLAQHPAAIHLSWNTTPHSHTATLMDYNLGGPLNARSATGADTAVALSGSVISYQKPAFITDNDQPPSLAKGSACFGFEIDLTAFSKTHLELWQAILEQNNSNTIKLYSATGYSIDLENRIKQLTATTGMSQRISLWENYNDVRALNDFLGQVDIFVSCFAPSSVYLLANCLAATVPIFAHAQPHGMEDRISADFVSSLGFDHWTSTSIEGFRNNLTRYASSSEALQKERDEIKDKLENTSLFNPFLFARQIEAVYTHIFDRHFPDL